MMLTIITARQRATRSPPPNMVKLIQYVTRTVSKLVVSILLKCLLVTAGKVMFLQVCVKNSVHKGEGWIPAFLWAITHPPATHPSLGRHPLTRHPLGRHPPCRPPTPKYYGIRSTSGWYASYWNAFLFWRVILLGREIFLRSSKMLYIWYL